MATNHKHKGLIGKLRRVMGRASVGIGTGFFVTGLMVVVIEFLEIVPLSIAWKAAFGFLMALVGLYFLGMKRELHVIGEAADTIEEAADTVGKRGKAAGKAVKKVEKKIEKNVKKERKGGVGFFR